MRLLRANGPNVITLCALFILATTLATDSQASSKGVGTIRVGVALPNLSYQGVTFDGNAGVDVGFTLGGQFGDYFRLDGLDFSYLGGSTVISGVNVDEFFLIIGTGVRLGLFAETQKLHPYVSIGIGGAYGQQDQSGFTAASGWGFEWNLGAGLEYQVNRHLGLGLRYRYRSSTINFLVATGGFPPFAYISPTVSAHTIGVEVSFMGP